MSQDGAVRIATWNVNSLRTRIDRVEAFLTLKDMGENEGVEAAK